MSVRKTTAKWELQNLAHLIRNVYFGAVSKGVIFTLLALGQLFASFLLRLILLAVPEIIYIKVALEISHKWNFVLHTAYPDWVVLVDLNRRLFAGML